MMGLGTAICHLQFLLSSHVLEACPEFLGLPESTVTLQTCHSNYPPAISELDWKVPEG